MAVSDAHVFPELTQLFFPKPPTTFLTCFCRGERQKYAGKQVCLNRGSNSQPPGHESDTLTTEPQVLSFSKLNEFAEDNFKFDGNGRQFSLQAMSPFTTVFLKDLYSRQGLVWETVKRNNLSKFDVMTWVS